MAGPQLTHAQKTRRIVTIASLMLFALLCVIAAVLWNDVRHASPVAQVQTDLQSIRIERPEFPDMVLQADTKGHWKLTDPCVLPINIQRLQPLLGALRPAAQSYAAADVDLAAAGLLHPEAVIVMNEQVLALGITDLSGERRYLLRGERVEFVPEWVLSLVNGGLSALASLNVFPQSLHELTIDSDQGNEPSSLTLQAGELAIWQALAAQQIVTWPLQNTESEIASHTLIAKTNDQELRLTLSVYSSFAALRYDNAACVYLIPASSLPDITLP